MSSYDMSDRWTPLSARNPLEPVAVYKQPTMPQKKIRCLVGDFYVGGGVVAEVGKTYSIDADLARALVKFGRAEYA